MLEVARRLLERIGIEAQPEHLGIDRTAVDDDACPTRATPAVSNVTTSSRSSPIPASGWRIRACAASDIRICIGSALEVEGHAYPGLQAAIHRKARRAWALGAIAQTGEGVGALQPNGAPYPLGVVRGGDATASGANDVGSGWADKQPPSALIGAAAAPSSHSVSTKNRAHLQSRVSRADGVRRGRRRGPSRGRGHTRPWRRRGRPV